MDLSALRLELPQFLNLFPQRAPRIMWLLGAGASVGAGLPTAWTLTWEFKRTLYCNVHKIPPARFPDLSSQGFQGLVQSYFDGKSGHPPLNSDEEYSFYFEHFLPDEADRRRFLDKRMRDLKPSYGHYCLAALIALQQIQLLWTTNFDQLIERAISHAAISKRATTDLSTFGLDCPAKAADVIRDEIWPVLVKIHGDYRYRKLLNTAGELESQDATLQQWLIDQSSRRGLAVVGYSGRDHSVMSSLSSVLDKAADPFPHGLFWFERHGTTPRPRVTDLLTRAKQKGCQACWIEIGGFDELMADLFLPHHSAFPEVCDILKEHRKGCHPASLSYGGHGWPVLRTNALEITKFPATCTVFKAEIGGAKQVKEVALPHRERIAAGRRKAGVIAFGTQADLISIFQAYQPQEFDRYPLDPKRFRYEESVELGLFYDAICQAVASKTGLCRSSNGKGRMLYVQDPAVLTEAEKTTLTGLGIQAIRRQGRDGPFIHEGIWLSLEHRDLRLWLLLEPKLMVTTDGTVPYAADDRSEIGREDLVARYNKKANSLLVFWIDFLSSRCGAPIALSFPSEQEPEARFEIDKTTAFSRRKK